MTQRVSQRTIKCQSRSWSKRGTNVNGSQHGDNPLLKPTGSKIATKSLPGPTHRQHRKPIVVKTMSLGTNYSSSKRNLGSLQVSLGQKEKRECPVHDTTKRRTSHFLAEPPRREKLSHRPSHTIVHALSKFELHWWSLHCVRVWGMLGPNLTRTCPTEAP